MLDIAVSYNRYKFLGHEYLTWLWFSIEMDVDNLKKLIPEMTSLDIGNHIVLENNTNKAGEKITIKGDDADLKEGILSLAKGALVTELQLIYKAENQEWLFTIKGESLSFFNLKLPQTGPLESKEDVDGLVLEKTYLTEKLVQNMDNLYMAFVQIRVTSSWHDVVVPKIKAWIHQRSGDVAKKL
jgi:hypothetical protein